jgi:hypothetical protein
VQLGPAGGLGQLHHRAAFPGDPYAIARDLLEDVTDEDRVTWRASRPIDWANMD